MTRILTRVYREGGRPLRQIQDLDRVLSTTTLRTLPLWILGSDEVKPGRPMPPATPMLIRRVMIKQRFWTWLGGQVFSLYSAAR